MAGMSSTDKTYIADMTAHHKNTIDTAKGYLAASPKDRNANLSDMADMTMKGAKMDMAKMSGMMGKGSKMDMGAK